jgi:hypothetical protein
MIISVRICHTRCLLFSEPKPNLDATRSPLQPCNYVIRFAKPAGKAPHRQWNPTKKLTQSEEMEPVAQKRAKYASPQNPGRLPVDVLVAHCVRGAFQSCNRKISLDAIHVPVDVDTSASPLALHV